MSSSIGDAASDKVKVRNVRVMSHRACNKEPAPAWSSPLLGRDESIRGSRRLYLLPSSEPEYISKQFVSGTCTPLGLDAEGVPGLGLIALAKKRVEFLNRSLGIVHLLSFSEDCLFMNKMHL